MMSRMDRICVKVSAARPAVPVPPGFAGRVMAHLRERTETALDSWFINRVAMPLMAGGGAASLGLGLAWAMLWQAGYASELSLMLAGQPWAGF